MKEILNYYENEKKAFEGYEVPEKLKQTASLIMFRFNIEGKRRTFLYDRA